MISKQQGFIIQLFVYLYKKQINVNKIIVVTMIYQSHFNENHVLGHS